MAKVAIQPSYEISPWQVLLIQRNCHGCVSVNRKCEGEVNL